MFEFCEKCGSIMVPSSENESVLECSLCKEKKKITEEIHDSYIF